jgi:hypothetical protein
MMKMSNTIASIRSFVKRKLRAASSAMLISALAFAMSPAEAQSRDAAYLCSTEVAAGLVYDAAAKRWHGAELRINDKFVLRLQYVRSRTLDDGSGQQSVDDYNVTIVHTDEKASAPCVQLQTNSRSITMDQSMTLSCTSNAAQYQFDLNSNRFIRGSLGGYTDGSDSRNVSPAIGAGHCMKAE